MPYTKASLREAVRAMLQNISALTLSDQRLDILLAQAKRRLDKDKPNYVTADIAGNGKKYYQLTNTVTEWINQFSTIDLVQNPKVIVANDDPVTYEDPKNISILEQDSLEYLRMENGISSGTTASVKFSTRWKVQDIDGATTTTLPTKLQNALEYIAASNVCISLSSKSAGQLDEQIEADLINWQGKQAQYKFAARDWEELYLLEIGLDKAKVKPVMLRMDYDQDPGRISYLTHKSRG